MNVILVPNNIYNLKNLLSLKNIKGVILSGGNDIIYKNVFVPLEIIYDLKKDFCKPPNTVIFNEQN